jgi:hypothetical protein
MKRPLIFHPFANRQSAGVSVSDLFANFQFMQWNLNGCQRLEFFDHYPPVSPRGGVTLQNHRLSMQF